MFSHPVYLVTKKGTSRQKKTALGIGKKKKTEPQIIQALISHIRKTISFFHVLLRSTGHKNHIESSICRLLVFVQLSLSPLPPLFSNPSPLSTHSLLSM